MQLVRPIFGKLSFMMAEFAIEVIEPDKFPARFNLELFGNLQDSERNIFTPKVVYDRRKNVFSPRELRLGESGSRKVHFLFFSVYYVFLSCLSFLSCSLLSALHPE